MKPDSPYRTKTGNKVHRKPNWGVFFGALPVACFGLYMTYGFYLSYQKQRDASVSYEPVSARILSTQVESTSHGTPRTSGSTRVYQPHILYEYEVNGRTYRSHKYSYTFGVYGSAEEAQAVIDRYPVGSEQTVYFNPDEPATAVLRKSSPQPWWEYFWLPVVFDAFCFLAMLAGWRGWLGKSE